MKGENSVFPLQLPFPVATHHHRDQSLNAASASFLSSDRPSFCLPSPVPTRVAIAAPWTHSSPVVGIVVVDATVSLRRFWASPTPWRRQRNSTPTSCSASTSGSPARHRRRRSHPCYYVPCLQRPAHTLARVAPNEHQILRECALLSWMCSSCSKRQILALFGCSSSPSLFFHFFR